VNVAAIPTELVESALFGHERGSFTGAVKQQLGKFELASGGTLFLDEIGELKPEVQAKILRAIQESEVERVGGSRAIKVDLRLITATNVDLDRAVREGRFREDLYYRINVIPIRLPALRERVDDLPELAEFFIRRYNVKFRKTVLGIEESAMDVLRAYRWPGNIRELENLIERLIAVNDKDWISAGDLPYEYHLAPLVRAEEIPEGLLDRACETFERNFILKALERANWNVTATARNLGVPLSTMKHKIERLDIKDIARKLRGV
jgi:transcriptional regulator with PAS, ATPase and Fis domain